MYINSYYNINPLFSLESSITNNIIDINANDISSELFDQFYVDINKAFFRKLFECFVKKIYNVKAEKLKYNGYISIFANNMHYKYKREDFFHCIGEQRFGTIDEAANLLHNALFSAQHIAIIDILDIETNERYRQYIELNKESIPNYKELEDDKIDAIITSINDMILTTDTNCTDLAIEINYHHNMVILKPFISFENSKIKVLL